MNFNNSVKKKKTTNFFNLFQEEIYLLPKKKIITLTIQINIVCFISLFKIIINHKCDVICIDE